jgi:hypothetical protein
MKAGEDPIERPDQKSIPELCQTINAQFPSPVVARTW